MTAATTTADHTSVKSARDFQATREDGRTYTVREVIEHGGAARRDDLGRKPTAEERHLIGLWNLLDEAESEFSMGLEAADHVADLGEVERDGLDAAALARVTGRRQCEGVDLEVRDLVVWFTNQAVGASGVIVIDETLASLDDVIATLQAARELTERSRA